MEKLQFSMGVYGESELTWEPMEKIEFNMGAYGEYKFSIEVYGGIRIQH